MPAELVSTNGHKAPEFLAVPMPEHVDDAALRRWAHDHLKAVRRLKFHVAAYAVGMVVLTPLWLLVEWVSNGSFERFSDNSYPGDWDPWILWVALIWGFVVSIMALRVHFDRPTTPGEVDRELQRLSSR